MPATQAQLRNAIGLAFDATGNLFIADGNNARIRKVDLNGIISTVAGHLGAAFGGDGGPATDAFLNFPADVAIDHKGNLFIADWLNFRVRRVDTAGTITTFMGNGIEGYNGNNLPATSTNVFPMGVTVDKKGVLYVNDLSSSRIWKVH
jgi:sugar lactone lactonase YvrE